MKKDLPCFIIKLHSTPPAATANQQNGCDDVGGLWNIMKHCVDGCGAHKLAVYIYSIAWHSRGSRLLLCWFRKNFQCRNNNKKKNFVNFQSQNSFRSVWRWRHLAQVWKPFVCVLVRYLLSQLLWPFPLKLAADRMWRKLGLAGAGTRIGVAKARLLICETSARWKTFSLRFYVILSIATTGARCWSEVKAKSNSAAIEICPFYTHCARSDCERLLRYFCQ